MGRITALRARRGRPRRVEIELDGQPWLTAPLETVAGLTVGTELDAPGQTEIRERAAEAEALQVAGRLLARRRQTEQELRRRWERRGLQAPGTERAMARLRRSGQVDDAAFAREWVESRMAFRPRGAILLRQELRAKGVGATAIAAALKDLDETAAARRAAEKAWRRWGGLASEVRRGKIEAYLARRGFGHDTIRSVVDGGIATAGASEE